jgi:hypothetical protein
VYVEDTFCPSFALSSTSTWYTQGNYRNRLLCKFNAGIDSGKLPHVQQIPVRKSPLVRELLEDIIIKFLNDHGTPGLCLLLRQEDVAYFPVQTRSSELTARAAFALTVMISELSCSSISVLENENKEKIAFGRGMYASVKGSVISEAGVIPYYK